MAVGRAHKLSSFEPVTATAAPETGELSRHRSVPTIGGVIVDVCGMGRGTQAARLRATPEMRAARGRPVGSLTPVVIFIAAQRIALKLRRLGSFVTKGILP